VRKIVLQGREIGPGMRPLIIAELSGNHGKSLDRALALVEAAAGAGADAVKLQTYTAETMTLDLEGKEFSIDDPASLWKGRSLYGLYQEACTPWEWHKPIFDRCRKSGMIGFSTPFDGTAVDFLESLEVPCYKIASFENVDLPLIRKAASTGKPVIISGGMASVAELDDAVRTARAAGCENLVLLKCTSSYPASPAESNLLTLPHMRDLFDVQVGLSDHTLGIGAAVASVALGASVIEKHFTLRRADGGVDAAFSLEPEEMKALVQETTRAWQALGSVRYGPGEAEGRSLQFRRSLYVTRDMRAGERFTTENLRVIRPGMGLPPKYIDVFLGRRVAKDVRKGTPASWDLLGNGKE
jgi:pseudaminic acid synthase